MVWYNTLGYYMIGYAAIENMALYNRKQYVAARYNRITQYYSEPYHDMQ